MDEFYDMSSGGTKKTEFDLVVIQADQSTAEAYFKFRFGLDPHNTTCDCCGEDFSVYEWNTKELALTYRHKTSLVVGGEVVRAGLAEAGNS